jgi:tetrahydromethanopterin S-methyltransferase subunit G
MEDLLKFSHFLKLSRDARKLILDMVKSMQSLFPYHPVLTGRASRMNYTMQVEHITEILKMAHEKPEIFDGIMNPEEIEKYIKAASEFREIGDRLEKLMNTIRDYQLLANHLSYSLAMMIKEHLEMVQPDDCKSLNEKLAELNHQVTFSINKSKTNLKVV